MTTTELRLRCPWCGKVNELATGVEGAEVPHAGAISLCVSCGHWSIYELDFIGLRQRKPTEEEWMDMEDDETVRTVTLAWRKTFAPTRKDEA